ncbi:GNAT family N-acetyltransferase [Halovulum dunhuangense]|uniref:GNAT family N-acetyltransferase n=1 Tax=Halovulum dunhuangense TaxID=1505036 RepID=A0A849L2V7_9RHOB|nr:GNAT family N-acetyltransferase [Halovulum dunhuangense]NNU80547.1 GNAT family N-acetyltransferase [Halovulum dunhuangense]
MSPHVTLIGRHNTALLDHVAEGVFAHPPTAAHLGAYLADPAQRLFVAVQAGRVVGQLSAVLHRHPDKAPGLYIEELGVATALRRQGIATALMQAAVTLARNLGCAEIWLATEADNHAARAFYATQGLSGQQVVMFSRLL